MAGNFATKVNDLLPEIKVDGKYVTIEDCTKFTLAEYPIRRLAP